MAKVVEECCTINSGETLWEQQIWRSGWCPIDIFLSVRPWHFGPLIGNFHSTFGDIFPLSWWIALGFILVILILSNSYWATPLIFSPKNVFSFPTTWSGWKSFKSTLYCSFNYEFHNWIICSHILPHVVKRSHAALWMLSCLDAFFYVRYPSSFFLNSAFHKALWHGHNSAKLFDTF